MGCGAGSKTAKVEPIDWQMDNTNIEALDTLLKPLSELYHVAENFRAGFLDSVDEMKRLTMCDKIPDAKAMDAVEI